MSTPDLPVPPEKGGTLGKPLKLLNHPVRDTIPVYLAALGRACDGFRLAACVTLGT